MQSSFRVAFGTVARTVVYADDRAQLVFTFDFQDDSHGQLVLEHHAHSELAPELYRLAFERTKDYLQNCGYVVSAFGHPQFAEDAAHEAVLNRIASAVESLSGPMRTWANECGQFLPPDAFEAGSDHGQETWTLWRVFECNAPPVTVVFDPGSGQFGVAQGPVFQGFWGSLDQTLRAISDA